MMRLAPYSQEVPSHPTELIGYETTTEKGRGSACAQEAYSQQCLEP